MKGVAIYRAWTYGGGHVAVTEHSLSHHGKAMTRSVTLGDFRQRPTAVKHWGRLRFGDWFARVMRNDYSDVLKVVPPRAPLRVTHDSPPCQMFSRPSQTAFHQVVRALTPEAWL